MTRVAIVFAVDVGACTRGFYVFIWASEYRCGCALWCVSALVCAYVHEHVRACICVRVCIGVYMHAFICMRVFVRACVDA